MYEELKAKNKFDNKEWGMTYDHWIREVVLKGNVSEYMILKYPDVVHLYHKEINGNDCLYKTIERKKAEEELKKYPDAYKIVDINVRNLFYNDAVNSREIAAKIKEETELLLKEKNIKEAVESSTINLKKYKSVSMRVAFIILLIVIVVLIVLISLDELNNGLIITGSIIAGLTIIQLLFNVIDKGVALYKRL